MRTFSENELALELALELELDADEKALDEKALDEKADEALDAIGLPTLTEKDVQVEPLHENPCPLYKFYHGKWYCIQLPVHKFSRKIMTQVNHETIIQWLNHLQVLLGKLPVDRGILLHMGLKSHTANMFLNIWRNHLQTASAAKRKSEPEASQQS